MMIAARMPFCVLILLVLSSASARSPLKPEVGQGADAKTTFVKAERNLLGYVHESFNEPAATPPAVDGAMEQAGSTANYPPITEPAGKCCRPFCLPCHSGYKCRDGRCVKK